MSKEPTSEQKIELYRRMLLIRRMEERLSEDFNAGKLPGGVHLYIGQEAVATGVCEHLGDDDWIASTHRGHGHFLAKGGDPAGMLAEVHAKAGGICGGFGGSMHVADFSRGIIGANGIVAGGMAITVGAALAAQLDNDGKVAICFFGDGAANQGVLMEALNVSTLWRLPMIFVCEHNQWSEFSPADTVTAGKIADRARAFDIPTHEVDGNDVMAVWNAAANAVNRARAGEGPSFIEAQTYRIFGHNESEIHWLSSSYREESEIEEWRKKDPIQAFASLIKSEGIVDESALETMNNEIMQIVEAASDFVEQSEEPDPSRMNDMMFHGQLP